MNSPRFRAYILLLLVSIIWGVAAPVIKYTITYLPPLVFLSYRFAISAIVALIFFALTKGPKIPHNHKERLTIGLYGFFTTTVSLGLLFLGLEKTTSLSGNVLSAINPILIAVAGFFFLHDHITNREKIGMGIALVGTMLTIFEPSLSGMHTVFAATLEGNLLIVASLLVGVVLAVQSKYLLRDHIPPITLTHLSFIIGFLTILPVTLLSYDGNELLRLIVHAPLSAHLGVLYMAILSGTLAYSLWHMGQKSIEISEVALFSYLMPIWGTPLSVFWLGETITPTFTIGAVIIAFGVVIAEWKKKKKRSSSQ